MIQPSTLNFLSQLAANNTREWFAAHKTDYEEAKMDVEHFATRLIAGISQFDKTIAGLEPKDCMFRIYRDARFSHDKSPYKTNFGVIAQRGGKRSQYAAYYVHIEPDNLFLSGGIYMLTPNVLKTLRRAIDTDFESFRQIIDSKSFKQYFTVMSDKKLVKVPPGFDKTSPAAEYLRHSNWYVMYPIVAADICSPDFVDKTLQVFKALHPLNAFFNQAIDAIE
jgi:uncharacterized protein (TIGR02453 family)